MTTKIHNLIVEVAQNRLLSAHELWSIISYYYPSKRGRAWAKQEVIKRIPLLKFRSNRDKRRYYYYSDRKLKRLLEDLNDAGEVTQIESIKKELNKYIEWLEVEYNIKYIGEWF